MRFNSLNYVDISLYAEQGGFLKSFLEEVTKTEKGWVAFGGRRWDAIPSLFLTLYIVHKIGVVLSHFFSFFVRAILKDSSNSFRECP